VSCLLEMLREPIVDLKASGDRYVLFLAPTLHALPPNIEKMHSNQATLHAPAHNIDNDTDTGTHCSSCCNTCRSVPAQLSRCVHHVCVCFVGRGGGTATFVTFVSCVFLNMSLLAHALLFLSQPFPADYNNNNNNNHNNAHALVLAVRTGQCTGRSTHTNKAALPHT
jgi:hypothetical protein